MDFRYEMTFTAELSELCPVLKSRALFAARAEKLALTSYELQESSTPDAPASAAADTPSSAPADTEIIFAAHIENTQLPGLAKNLLPRGADINLTAIFHADSDYAKMDMDYQIDIQGAPLSITLEGVALPAAPGSKIIYSGTLKASDPFFGRLIEKKILSYAPQVLENDKDLIMHILGN